MREPSWNERRCSANCESPFWRQCVGHIIWSISKHAPGSLRHRRQLGFSASSLAAPGWGHPAAGSGQARALVDASYSGQQEASDIIPPVVFLHMSLMPPFGAL